MTTVNIDRKQLMIIAFYPVLRIATKIGVVWINVIITLDHVTTNTIAAIQLVADQ